MNLHDLFEVYGIPKDTRRMKYTPSSMDLEYVRPPAAIKAGFYRRDYTSITLVPIVKEIVRIQPDIIKSFSAVEIGQIVHEIVHDKGLQRYKMNDKSHQTWAYIQEIAALTLEMLNDDINPSSEL